MKQVIEFFGSSIIAVLVASAVIGIFSLLPAELKNLAEMPLSLPKMETGENQAFLEYHITTRGEEAK